MLQAMHTPLHVELQHTLSTQLPEVHMQAAVQEPELARSGTHLTPEQWAFDLQAVEQAPEQPVLQAAEPLQV
jgi:hypothetical protein